MNNSEYGFILFLVAVVIIIIIIKLIKIGIMFKRNQKNQSQTRSFYGKVADQVNKNKKEK